MSLGPPSMGPGGLPPPFHIIERPSVHRPAPSGPTMSSSQGLGLPPYFHPSHQLHQGHQQGPGAPGFQTSRASSPQPPFTHSLPPTGAALVRNRSPHLPILPTLQPRHIGTFVFPRTPFPFLDFPSPPVDPAVGEPAPALLSEKETREIRATIYIPTGFLPACRPKRPRIWGGSPIPSFRPLFATPQLIHHMQSGMSYSFMRPHPSEIHGTRRVYTDDSDLFLCALHAGLVSWSTTQQARKDGKDLRLEVRLSREARFVGGPGSKYLGTQDGTSGSIFLLFIKPQHELGQRRC